MVGSNVQLVPLKLVSTSGSRQKLPLFWVATVFNGRAIPAHPRKRLRHSEADEVAVKQVFSFIAALNADQVSTAASVLFEHYIKITSNTTTPQAEDIEGLQTILSLMKTMAIQSR